MMVKYDFDKLTERRGTNSYKWDVLDDADVLPMWVADMDFEVAPAITKALQERVATAIMMPSLAGSNVVTTGR